MHRPLRALSAFALVVACSTSSARRAGTSDFSTPPGGGGGSTASGAEDPDAASSDADAAPSDADVDDAARGFDGPFTTFLDAEAGAVVYPPPCDTDVAFQAAGSSFVYPTPSKLASALSELTYDGGTHPIAVAIQGKLGRGAAASATLGASLLWGFPVNTKATTVWFEPGGVRFGTPQASSTLGLVDKMGPTSLVLQGVTVHAFMGPGCASSMITLDAVLPASEGPHVLHLASGDVRVDALADDASRDGGGGAAFTGAPLRMIFTAESVPFDFATMP